MTVKVDQHGLTVQASRPALSQTLTIGGASVASAPFSTGPVGAYAQGAVTGVPVTTPNNTMHVRLLATAGCWIVFGKSPVAVAGVTPALYLVGGIPEYFWVYPGEQVAVVQDGGAGILNIAEMVA